MKVLFLRPNIDVYESFELGKRTSIMPPLGLLYLAAYLEGRGHEVHVLDAEAKRMDDNEVMERIGQIAPEIVASGATTPEIDNTANFMGKIKRKFPGILTVVGGPHPSALPERTLQEYGGLDFVIKGEGEEALSELIEALGTGGALSEVKGLSFRDANGIVRNPDRLHIENIDALPFPARHLVDPDDYKLTVPVKGNTRATMVQTMRGCPFKCIFCYRSKNPSPVRFRSPKRVIDEIEECVNKHSIQSVVFCDDTFTLFRERVFELCDEILKRGLDISWYCLARADTLDPELLHKMKSAGLVLLSIGVETGSQSQLDEIGKRTTLDQYRKAYDTVKNLAIEARGSFIIGLPNDTVKTIKDTIRFAKKLSLNEAFFNIATPYPGTVLWDKAKQGEGLRLLTEDWSQYRRWGNSVIDLNGVSRNSLVHWQKRAMVEFFLRPHIIMHHVKYYLKHGHFLLDYQPNLFNLVVNLIREPEDPPLKKSDGQ